MLASWIKRYAFGEGKIWKQIIDDKYDTHNPNIFSCNIEWSFPFLEKCDLVAPKAAKFGTLGKWAMVNLLDSGKINGVVKVVWPHNSGIFTILLLSVT